MDHLHPIMREALRSVMRSPAERDYALQTHTDYGYVGYATWCAQFRNHEVSIDGFVDVTRINLLHVWVDLPRDGDDGDPVSVDILPLLGEEDRKTLRATFTDAQQHHIVTYHHDREI